MGLLKAAGDSIHKGDVAGLQRQDFLAPCSAIGCDERSPEKPIFQNGFSRNVTPFAVAAAGPDRVPEQPLELGQNKGLTLVTVAFGFQNSKKTELYAA
ncbi:hypothetical protein [Cribrihabitans pelagius]|uniref:hypothetical protein n=1 Tax=Cribrihabitans pelagius TaxID=1765746 RepID=UPI003B595BA3